MSCVPWPDPDSGPCAGTHSLAFAPPGALQVVEITLHWVVVLRQHLCETAHLGRKIDVDDLVASTEVAELLGLGNPTSVSVYQTRYPDMPRPIVHRRSGRCQYWSCTDIEVWARATGRIK